MHRIKSMIYFNVSFSRIIDNSNVKIKTLAEQTGVDRASIYQYKSGKVLPSKEFLDKFISVMQLSNSEENELRESYKIALIGVSTYIKRKQIQRCLEILNDSITDNEQTGYKPSTTQIRRPDCTAEFNGREKIATLIKNAIDYEFALANEGLHEVNINTFIPSGYNEFFQHLSELYHSHKGTTINFNPIISFTKSSTQEGNDIIDALSSIMYFIFTDCPGYNPRFYYDEKKIWNSIGILYPYYIITTKHLILLDANLTNAQVIVNQYTIDTFHRKFDEAYANTKPLIKRLKKLTNITDLFLSKTGSPTSEWFACCAGSGGCIEKFSDNAMIEKYLEQSLADLNETLNYLISIKQNKTTSNYIEFQTSSAITEFAETGIIQQIQGILKEPLSPEDRKILLSKALEYQNEMGNIIDSNKIKFPPVCLIGIKNDCIILYIQLTSDVLIISEPEIANAFCDFFYSLSENESIIMKPEEVRQLLKDAIAICDKKIAKLNS